MNVRVATLLFPADELGGARYTSSALSARNDSVRRLPQLDRDSPECNMANDHEESGESPWDIFGQVTGEDRHAGRDAFRQSRPIILAAAAIYLRVLSDLDDKRERNCPTTRPDVTG